MKTKLTLFLITICFYCNAQIISKTEKNNLSIITNTPLLFFNGSDNIVYRGERTFHHSFDAIVIDPESKVNKAYIFNENDQISQTIEYNGDPYSCTVFYYTKDRKLENSYYLGNISDAEVILDSIARDKNYLKTNFLALARLCDQPLMTKYKYNQAGHLSSAVIINRNGEEKTTEYLYDDKGRIIKLLQEKQLKYIYDYDVNNNIILKQSATQSFTSPLAFVYTEAERYVYINNELTQIDQICKSNKKVNINIPSKKVNESVPLTPKLAGSVIYLNSSMAKMSLINNINPKWETTSSIVFENTLNEFQNWSTRKTFTAEKNKPKSLSRIEFQTFSSSVKIKEARLKKEQSAREADSVLRQEKIQKQEKSAQDQKLKDDLYEKKQRLYDLKLAANKKNDEIWKQYTTLLSPNTDSKIDAVNRISDNLKIMKAKRKKVLFETYVSTYSHYIASNDELELSDLVLVQDNMKVILNSKTKRIEKEILDQQTMPEKLLYFKNALNYIDN